MKSVYPINPLFEEKAYIKSYQYDALYQESITHPEQFWALQAKKLTWTKPWTKVVQGSFKTLDVQWFVNGKLNACYNCIDRHLNTKAQQVALIWEGNSPDESRSLTYAELHDYVCRFANVLKGLGVKKGDRVCIYLPMIPELIVAILACARIGAIHSIVFAGFSPAALKSRILDANCEVVITADEGLRGDKVVPLKKNCDDALRDCPDVKHVLVIERTGNRVLWHEGRDRRYHDEMSKADSICPVEEMDASDPLFILYTSGSTGKPKGIVHATGGYLVYVAITHQYVFDYHPGDIYWCTADIGWITGHSYGVYGPLLNGATSILFEGIPSYPTYSRYWEIIDKHQVNILYTAPTAIRALRKEGDHWLTKSSRKSLKLLGTVGEPINPEVWEWYFNIVGQGQCPIVDTWWQTETGGILISPLPGATSLIPGSATRPFFGIQPEIVDERGASIEVGASGRLVIKQPWPGLMQTIYGDHQRFYETYFKDVPGSYLTGDGAYQDEFGNFTITGRLDDVIKVSGHRIGTEEIESALISHAAVAEAAVVGIPDELTGESIFAFVTTQADITPTEDLKTQLIQHVRNVIGPIAKIAQIQWAESLPKTRSGKIMRRILRKIANHDIENLGDISTLADPSVIEQLIQ